MAAPQSGGAAFRVRQAEETLAELRTALEKAGIVLPSLRLDPVALAREAPCPLIDLGRCSVETATRLAAALR
ncbi:hypothetical protein M3765_08965 [Streptomyces thermoviolaceus]|uniref:hypothetical protein n=1 Tax=Streptomyces TaxID=1883 RepID=UPI000F7428F8|nr:MULTISPECIES: hypothetical protein [Streptomyces]MCM3264167.1 hypothetical protein [Streptomyces thermoviolaceus]RSS04156.1 hypothetical protein EF917_11220 [Streptomyces sp. WAC00469]